MIQKKTKIFRLRIFLNWHYIQSYRRENWLKYGLNNTKKTEIFKLRIFLNWYYIQSYRVKNWPKYDLNDTKKKNRNI